MIVLVVPFVVLICHNDIDGCSIFVMVVFVLAFLVLVLRFFNVLANY